MILYSLTKDDVENILKLLQKWNKHIEGEVWKQIFTNLPYLSTRLRAVVDRENLPNL